MKRKLLCAFALSLALMLAGCGSREVGDQPTTADPGMVETGGEQTPEDPWGITLTAEEITPTGMTLVITQAGGSMTGELQFGAPFHVERLNGEEWEPAAEVLVDWTMEAYTVEPDSTTRWPVSWRYIYGELPAGRYRLGKELGELRAPGDYETRLYYADFELK